MLQWTQLNSTAYNLIAFTSLSWLVMQQPWWIEGMHFYNMTMIRQHTLLLMLSSQPKSRNCSNWFFHPAYSPELASTDYHMFRSMTHFLRRVRTFDSLKVVENGCCRRFFAFKSAKWYRCEVKQLAQKWTKVIKWWNILGSVMAIWIYLYTEIAFLSKVTWNLWDTLLENNSVYLNDPCLNNHRL